MFIFNGTSHFTLFTNMTMSTLQIYINNLYR